MGDHRLPKRVMSGELEYKGKRGPGEEWADCVAEDRRLFCITGNWSTAALDPGVWYSTVRVGEGRGKGIRTPAEEEGSGRGRQG